ncbi:ferritin [Breznakibacter xylanolyticus]|uniref:Ferritin n=1 Tax=Breznakibacter xylanolyticus TaxID=990 RepID=A0A2W7NC29_9BACT|nr:ferritin [Breznakibacter xylanolyticus]MBN2743450.1 ferritin [Marinilabiliaceae bacterium]PZX17921.1 ferritin [Breznakibacter xylanolyticus]
MLNKKVEKILVEQIEKEAYSSNLYLAMASWAENQGLKGSSDWLYAQADEERMHMLKFVKYVNERGGKAVISALQQPPADFKSVKALFDEVLKHEQYVSESINNIVAVCYDEKDFTTMNWIQWFVTEQIEEEASVQEIIDKLNLLGDGNLYQFDRDIMSLRSAQNAAAE